MSEPSERARELAREIHASINSDSCGFQYKQKRCFFCEGIADLLTRYASAARLEEAEWWKDGWQFNKLNISVAEQRLAEFRAAQQKAPGETK